MQQQQHGSGPPSMGGPHVIYPPGTVVVQPGTCSREEQIRQSYSKQQSLVLGILQILCGVVAISLNIALIALAAEVSYISYGIWCGLFFLAAGALGIMASKNPSSCTLTSHMVLSIFASCFCIVLLVFAGIGAAEDGEQHDAICRYFGKTCRDNAKYGLNVTLVVLALLELMLAIWAAAICCAGLCCSNRVTAGTVITANQQVRYNTATNSIHVQPYGQQYGYTNPQYYSSPASTSVPPYDPFGQMQPPPAYAPAKS